jgi:hypothetical protein
MSNSPQAGLPTKRSAYQILDALGTPQQSSGILPPLLVVANGQALDKASGTHFRILQNCGTVPVKFLIDNDNNCTADMFHGVLAACTVQDDGTGGIINFDKVGDRVSIIGVGGNPRVSVFVGTLSNYSQA